MSGQHRLAVGEILEGLKGEAYLKAVEEEMNEPGEGKGKEKGEGTPEEKEEK
jgi:hypothetical protein